MSNIESLGFRRIKKISKIRVMKFFFLHPILTIKAIILGIKIGENVNNDDFVEYYEKEVTKFVNDNVDTSIKVQMIKQNDDYYCRTLKK